jgi:hypothetical protein
MYQIWHLKKIGIVLGMYFVLAGCGDSKKPAPTKSNTITITPSTSTPTQTEKVNQVSLDKSPMDMAYYPVEYPKLKMSGHLKEPLIARVIYSRPLRNNRTIFGELVKYGSVWRLGANEATEIEFFKDVNINNKKVAKGRYVMYCIPQENTWTVVLNNDLYIWGLKIDSTKDAYKFDIPVAKTRYPYECFTMEFEKIPGGAQLTMAWDSVKGNLPIKW